MNALDLLISDHRQVDELFAKLEQVQDAKQGLKLFTQLSDCLTLHAMIEEQIFYPALKEHPELAKMLTEAFEEHGEMKNTLTKTGGKELLEKDWKSSLKKLQGEVKHHVNDEETKLFPKVREVFDAAKLTTLGKKLQLAKDEGLTSAKLPPLTLHTSAETQQHLH